MRGIRRGARLAVLAGALAALVAAAPAAATPGWITPSSVSAPGITASAPAVAVTPTGETVAAWVRSNVVEVAVRPAGGTFTAPVVVSNANADPASPPAIAVARDGRVLLTWRDKCDTSRSACTAEAILRDPGGPWGAPVSLSGTGAGPPHGVFTSDGRAVVAWERHAAIEAAIALPRAGFSPPAVVDASQIDVSSPDLATDAYGRAYLVWGAATPSAAASQDASLRLAISPAGSRAFSAPAELQAEASSVNQTTVDVISYASPKIAVDSAGNAAVAWIRSDVRYDEGPPTVTTIFTSLQALSRAATGVVTEPQDLDSGITTTGLSVTVSAATLAVDGPGDVAAVWTKRNMANATTAVWAATRAAGATTFAGRVSAASGQKDAQPTPGSASVVAVGHDSFLLGFLQSGVVQTAVAQRTNPFGSPAAVSPAGAAPMPQFAGAADGDAVGIWPIQDGNVFRAQVAAYDATGPELRGLQTPARARTGEPVVFSVSPFDTWSTDVGASWSFGDGTDAVGTSVTHAFARAGDYTVTVAAADALGNLTTTTRSVAVSRATRPKIKGLRLTRSRFAVAARATAVSARTPRGTTIRLTLSEPATVRLYIKRVLRGHRSGRRCSIAVRSGKRCNVYRAAGKLTRKMRRTRANVRFTGRIGRRPLKPGRYRITAIAKDAAGSTSTPVRRFFTIVR